ncbi:MAG TPA: hypothetical protein DEP17_02350 [Lachnospiraceae bacterium]|nr:hypothetical protein [Lachnospiraceae bacterium]
MPVRNEKINEWFFVLYLMEVKYEYTNFKKHLRLHDVVYSSLIPLRKVYWGIYSAISREIFECLAKFLSKQGQAFQFYIEDSKQRVQRGVCL